MRIVSAAVLLLALTGCGAQFVGHQDAVSTEQGRKDKVNARLINGYWKNSTIIDPAYSLVCKDDGRELGEVKRLGQDWHAETRGNWNVAGFYDSEQNAKAALEKEAAMNSRCSTVPSGQATSLHDGRV